MGELLLLSELPANNGEITERQVVHDDICHKEGNEQTVKGQ